MAPTSKIHNTPLSYPWVATPPNSSSWEPLFREISITTTGSLPGGSQSLPNMNQLREAAEINCQQPLETRARAPPNSPYGAAPEVVTVDQLAKLLKAALLQELESASTGLHIQSVGTQQDGGNLANFTEPGSHPERSAISK
jgi:hypothetical protein